MPYILKFSRWSTWCVTSFVTQKHLQRSHEKLLGIGQTLPKKKKEYLAGYWIDGWIINFNQSDQQKDSAKTSRAS